MSSELLAAPQGDQVVVLRRSVEEFRIIALRFEHLAIQETDLADLHRRQIQEMVRAGRLFVEVIDAGGFPESRKDKNQGWWDRERGMVPAGPFLFLDLFKGENGTLKIENGVHIRIELSAEDERRYMEAVRGNWEPAQYVQCWPSVISWLVSKFPARFAHEAVSLFGNNVLTKGRVPVDRDGKPIPAIYSVDGVEQPEGYKPLPMKAYPKGTQVSWARKFVTEADVFTEANTMSKFRGMARANADGCRMLAILIGDYVADIENAIPIVAPGNAPKPPGARSRRKGGGRQVGPLREFAAWLIDSGHLERHGRKWTKIVTIFYGDPRMPATTKFDQLRKAVEREECARKRGQNKRRNN